MWRNGWHDLKRPLNRVILVPINFSYTTSYRLSIVTFALGCTVQPQYIPYRRRRQTDAYCSISATTFWGHVTSLVISFGTKPLSLTVWDIQWRMWCNGWHDLKRPLNRVILVPINFSVSFDLGCTVQPQYIPYRRRRQTDAYCSIIATTVGYKRQTSMICWVIITRLSFSVVISQLIRYQLQLINIYSLYRFINFLLHSSDFG